VPGTARPVRIVGDPALSTPTRKVTEFDDELAQLIDDMFETNRIASGAGLAAPQIGDDRAVFVYDCRDDNGVRHTGYVVNPEVVVADGQLDAGEEGCLSVPGPFHELARPTHVVVRGVDKHNKPVEVTGTGFFARCLLHETDHLRGILFIDHLPRNRRRRLLRDMTPFDWNAPMPTGAM
jgi:peptide deformylase